MDEFKKAKYVAEQNYTHDKSIKGSKGAQGNMPNSHCIPYVATIISRIMTGILAKPFHTIKETTTMSQ